MGIVTPSPAAAICHLLIESAQLCGVEWRGYPREASLRA
jgi:hypothetical protein